MKDYDAMIEVEDVLIEKLSEANEVDGHDAGTDEVNIFIHTDNPESAFDEIKAILGSSAYWVDAKVAYREVSKSEYTILWPKGLNKFKVA
jgi:hypothetical protein